MEIVVVDDPAALATRAADIVEEEIGASSSTMLGLAGGSTPIPTHDELASRGLDWSGVTAWLPDERWTAPDSEDANQRMARETLTDRCGIRLVAPNTTTDPTSAANAYEELVVPLLTADARSLVMLGMGSDGHTASLFPGTDALDIESASYVANYVPAMDTWRLTATFELIATADRVLFLVAGSAKAARLAEIQSGLALPAGRVRAKEGVMWLVDADAAAKLA
ncbi:MAG: 6-phosphogluconolactonase [Acidimicrobiia bacterium]